ncbi:hypothetical protein DSO57_1010018 [Entomophthora muscae]|uniref:Uncharacterized protein n=1 Tax=Entomophthora muscae TaxID=34485 RepID=A0ACC2S8R3_9FUNG|nr:hypothetical protein DSO57_1010018 [Entomophthora muscae]
MTIDQAKLWSAMAFHPDKAIKWGNKGFTPHDARRWAFIGITPAISRTLKEARWNPYTVHLWGPFKEWTPETATEWKSNGYTHVEMKYWLGIGMTMTEARSWQAVGVTTQLHKTLDNNKITLEEWEKWKQTTSLAKAAMWIAKGFTPTTAALWMEHKVPPPEAAFLKGNLSPADTAKWLGEGIQSEHILKWRDLLPKPKTAGLYTKNDFSPKYAAEWYDIGATAAKADIFRQGGWNPVTVINWLHTNRLAYGDINKYIHPTI